MTREPASIPPLSWEMNAPSRLNDYTLQTKHEFYYAAGIQEGLQRHEDELALVKSQRDTAALETVNMRARIRDLEQRLEHYERSQKAVSVHKSFRRVIHAFIC
ncbi:hypothetical protein MPER_04994 [Moniliophthora perniciosa FA553]|nr:hypothetical protein MPER_04994 [Moniliophthora perniciosa FA553]